MSRDEWNAKYRARFAEKARGPEGQLLTDRQLDAIVSATELGQADYEDDPATVADEEMSYWDDD